MYICIYVYMYICVYVYMYICIYKQLRYGHLKIRKNVKNKQKKIRYSENIQRNQLQKPF